MPIKHNFTVIKMDNDWYQPLCDGEPIAGYDITRIKPNWFWTNPWILYHEGIAFSPDSYSSPTSALETVIQEYYQTARNQPATQGVLL